jgi:hypothetical protein
MNCKQMLTAGVTDYKQHCYVLTYEPLERSSVSDLDTFVVSRTYNGNRRDVLRYEYGQLDTEGPLSQTVSLAPSMSSLNDVCTFVYPYLLLLALHIKYMLYSLNVFC